MNTVQRFRKIQQREFFAHHMLLHAADREIEDAQASEVGRFNKCLAAMVLCSLAIETLANAVGSRIVSNWETFERLSPVAKLEALVTELAIALDQNKEPWSAVRQLARFRNDIAHPKPERIVEEETLPEVALEKSLIESPKSQIEREITLGNARRAHKAVSELKSILTDALPSEKRFGLYIDAWSGSTVLME